MSTILFCGKPCGILCDDHFLIGGDNVYLYLAAGLGKLNILTAGAVHVVLKVNIHTKIIKAGKYHLTQQTMILANTCGEYDGVHAAHCSRVCADVLLYMVSKALKGSLGASLPSLAAAVMSRKSEDTPEIPITPLFLFM